MDLPLGRPKFKWGGKREGAGRKKSAAGAKGLPHRRRRFHEGREPVHVTMKVIPGLPSLRRSDVAMELGREIRAATAHFAKTRPGFRVVEFSIQATHVHLIVEAGSTRTLGRGVQGMGIRIAKAVNRVLGRSGKVIADRYHARALATPREVRNALVYVIQNWRHHDSDAEGIDSRSSGRWFAGWRAMPPAPKQPSPVAPPKTWLVRIGWRRHGLIGAREAPADTPY
jgi:putative transposase